MFREMRRKNQLLPEAAALEILKNGTSGVLALSGDDDYPYAVPLSYVYANGKIYFHGAKTGHKTDAVKRNEKASFCVVEKDEIVPEEYTTYFRSVIAFGRIRILENDAEKLAAINLLADRYNPHASEDTRNQAVRREWGPLMMMEMTVEHMTGKEAIELVKKRK